jgi:peptidoglycan/xylan/chitin deacetylase (PgdA/CDA1 family)
MDLRAVFRRSRAFAKRVLVRASGAIYKLPQGGKEILLTFDDGPHPEVTEGVLDRLRDHRARAVFFVVGEFIDRAPSLLRRALAEGHVIGNHTFSHPARQPWLASYVRDVARCQRAVEGATGHRPCLFRPPLGRLSPASCLAPKFLGLKSVYWSVDSADWRLHFESGARECVERLTTAVGPGDVLLLHDDHPGVLSVLDELLPILVARGYDLASAIRHVAPGPALAVQT